MRALLLAAILALAAAPAQAERLITQVSQDDIAITSSFSGQTLTMFGSIEPEVGTTERPVGPYHVIITVTGPLQTRVARQKTNVLGIWLNTSQAEFTAFPSFYQVLSDQKLGDISNIITLSETKIPLDIQPIADIAQITPKRQAFAPQLVRLMEEKGMFKLNESGVVFRSDTFYFGQVTLPADAPPGSYLTHTYLFKDGKIVADKTAGFTVRKIGFERFIGQAARQQPLLYGLVCVALALFTGWLGGVVFKR